MILRMTAGFLVILTLSSLCAIHAAPHPQYEYSNEIGDEGGNEAEIEPASQPLNRNRVRQPIPRVVTSSESDEYGDDDEDTWVISNGIDSELEREEGKEVSEYSAEKSEEQYGDGDEDLTEDGEDYDADESEGGDYDHSEDDDYGGDDDDDDDESGDYDYKADDDDSSEDSDEDDDYDDSDEDSSSSFGSNERKGHPGGPGRGEYIDPIPSTSDAERQYISAYRNIHSADAFARVTRLMVDTMAEVAQGPQAWPGVLRTYGHHLLDSTVDNGFRQVFKGLGQQQARRRKNPLQRRRPNFLQWLQYFPQFADGDDDSDEDSDEDYDYAVRRRQRQYYNNRRRYYNNRYYNRVYRRFA